MIVAFTRIKYALELPWYIELLKQIAFPHQKFSTSSSKNFTSWLKSKFLGYILYMPQQAVSFIGRAFWNENHYS